MIIHMVQHMHYSIYPDLLQCMKNVIGFNNVAVDESEGARERLGPNATAEEKPRDKRVSRK